MAVRKEEYERRSRRVALRLRPDERASLEAYATACGLKYTEILRLALREHLRVSGYDQHGGDDIIPYKSRRKRQN